MEARLSGFWRTSVFSTHWVPYRAQFKALLGSVTPRFHGPWM